jgi:hypothetical protein
MKKTLRDLVDTNNGTPERRNAGTPESRNAGTPERRNAGLTSFGFVVIFVFHSIFFFPYAFVKRNKFYESSLFV